MADFVGVVYMAENEITGKKYIGITTVSLRWRMYQHKSDAVNNRGTVFNNAINKYGWETFKWKIIDKAETLQSLYEKEQKWISYYRSWIGYENCNGYNMTLGGEGTHGIGELDIETVMKIKELLRDTNMRYKEIGHKLDVNTSMVKDIYQGKSWNHVIVEGFCPNMQRDINHFVEKTQVKNIKIALMEGELSNRKIAKMNNISESLVSAIKFEQLHKDVQIPAFTEKINSFYKNKQNKIKFIKELLMKNLTYDQISAMTNMPSSIIGEVRNGEKYRHIFVSGFEEWKKKHPKIKQDKDLSEAVVRQIKTALSKDLDPIIIASNHDISPVRVYNIRKGVSYLDIEVEGFIPKEPDKDWFVGSKNPTSILNEEKISLIRALYKRRNCNQRQISLYFEISETNISDIIKKRIWKHVTDKHFDDKYLQNIENGINSKYPPKKDLLHREVVIAIKTDLLKGNESFENLSLKYGVSSNTISDINYKKTYAYITLSEDSSGPYRTKEINRQQSKKSNSKLTEEIVREIRIKFINGCRNIDVQREYSLSETTVNSIKRMRSWKWVHVDGYYEWLNT